MSVKKVKPIPRCEREGKRERLFSTNFPDNIKKSGIKCYVPWLDFLNLRNRYEKLVKRRRKHIDVYNISCGSLQSIVNYINEGDPDIQVIKAELGELILRAKNRYGRNI